MVDVTSKRSGKSNLKIISGVLAPTALQFDPLNPGAGVQEGNLSGLQTRLTNTVTSFRGKRDIPVVLDSPGAIISANHENNIKPKFDTGHTFFARKEEFYASHKRVVCRGVNNAFYLGPLVPAERSVPTSTGWLPWGTGNLATIVAPALNIGMGTTAIALSEPTRAPFSLFRSATEAIRDFPAIPLKAFAGSKTKLDATRNLGSEYLNVQFGLLPTGNDIALLADAVINFASKIDQYTRDVGKDVRRGYTFDPITTIKSDVFTQGLGNNPDLYGPALRYNYYWQPGVSYTVSQQQIITEEYWFTGCFTYYLDPLLAKLGPTGEFVAKANQILGFGGTFTALWELAPWSWLVDWFFNVKDLISVGEKLSKDSLVLRYGYLMRTCTMNYHKDISGLKPLVAGTPSAFARDLRITEKQRVRSTPIGFGIDSSTFTAQQWAIFGALGLTKAPKTLF